MYKCEMTGKEIRRSCLKCANRGLWSPKEEHWFDPCNACSRKKKDYKKSYSQFKLADCSDCAHNGEHPDIGTPSLCSWCVDMCNFYWYPRDRYEGEDD